jgi:dCMP deaminase
MWDRRFINLAEHIAGWSKDPSTKVGAVIVDGKRRVISMGYNGFPRGLSDDGRLNYRDTKLALTLHAEANAILFAKCDLVGATIYTWPMMPCSHCASLIIQSGINRVVSIPNSNPRWQESFALSQIIFEEAAVSLNMLHIPYPGS